MEVGGHRIGALHLRLLGNIVRLSGICMVQGFIHVGGHKSYHEPATRNSQKQLPSSTPQGP